MREVETSWLCIEKVAAFALLREDRAVLGGVVVFPAAAMAAGNGFTAEFPVAFGELWHGVFMLLG